MISNPQEEEEKQKDDVLQKINDALEKENWGDGCENLIFSVVFSGKCQIKSIFCKSKFDKIN